MPQMKNDVRNLNLPKFDLKVFAQGQKQVEEKFFKNLFSKFLNELPSFWKVSNRTIPFSFIYFWFSWRKFDKKTARAILKSWVSLGLCKLVPYHGIKINGEAHGKQKTR